ncbi:MAG: hypothetical protein MUC96_14290 [Myxococcaceae bacterium]|nr:hypothetical protein [Myxococcaceae bacterium]
MIRVDRGAAPASLESTRVAELSRVRGLAQRDSKALGNQYRVVADELWRRQFFKCAYCESCEQLKRNDVEHFRPKARADRRPGSSETHGYWWLTWSWENLLFACRNCNQSPAKRDQFPLAEGSAALTPEQSPPGLEQPLLIDPATESGVAHIQFRPVSSPGEHRWKPFPRNGSAKGRATIKVCKLDRDDLVELYSRHVREDVERRHLARIRQAHPASLRTLWDEAARELLARTMPFVGLSYDVLDSVFPPAERERLRLALPALDEL